MGDREIRKLRDVVTDLMRRAGCSKEDIDNFDYEYGFREEQV